MDPREEVIKKFERLALHKVPANFISILSNCLLHALEDYEVVPRCTDVAVITTENDEVLKMYVASMLVENKSTGTIKQYVDVLRRFECFVNKDFTECTAIDLRRYIAHVMSSGASSTTCNNYRSYICSFYSWMEQEEYMDRNVMKKVSPIKCNKIKEDPFSDVEIAMVRDSITCVRTRALIEFLLATGIRIDELCKMKVCDVSMDSLSVNVLHGKGDKERITYMTDTAKMYLEQYLKTRKHDSEFLFCNDRGGGQMKSCNIGKLLKKVSELSGVNNIHPHRFRHTLASRLAKAGMPPQEIQLLLGHSSVNTTMIYITTETDMIRNSYMRYSASA